MTTLFPDGTDTFTPPVAGEPLSLSGGRSSTQHVGDLQEAVEALEAAAHRRTSKTIVNANDFADLAAQVLNTADATTGWSATTGIDGLDTTIKTTGTASVKSHLQLDPAFDPGGDDYFYVTLPANVSKGAYSYVAFDFRWDYKVGLGDMSWLLDVVASDGVNLTGNAVASHMSLVTRGTWTTVYVALGALTSVRTIGIKKYHNDTNPASYFWSNYVWIDNVRFKEMTKLDVALGSADPVTVLVPADYSSANFQFPLVPSPTKTIIDQRAGKNFISHLNQRVYASEFGIDDTGATDVTANLQTALSSLSTGDTFEFTPNGLYRCDTALYFGGSKNITINGNGAKIVRYGLGQFGSGQCYSWASFSDNTQMRVNDLEFLTLSPVTHAGASLTTVNGSPAKPAGTAILAAQGDAVAIPGWVYSEDEKGGITVDIVCSQNGAQASDLQVEYYDGGYGGVGRPSSVTQAAGSEGGLAQGTYCYRLSFIDAEGRETMMGGAGIGTITTAWGRMTMTIPTYLPSAELFLTGWGNLGQPFIARKLYRCGSTAGSYGTAAFDPGNYYCIATFNHMGAVTYNDNGGFSPGAMAAGPAWSIADNGVGNVENGSHAYAVTTIHTAGNEKMLQYPGLTEGAAGYSGFTSSTARTFRLNNLPGAGDATCIARRIYRSGAGAAQGPQAINMMTLVAEQRASSPGVFAATFYDDNASDASLGIANFGSPPNKPPISQSQHRVAPGKGMPTVRITPTGSQSTITVTLPKVPNLSDSAITIAVRKTTSAVNSITINSVTTHSKRPTNLDGSGIVVGGNTDIELRNISVRGYPGYAFGSYGGGARFINCESVCSSMQGWDASSGQGLYMEECRIISPGAVGLDIETYDGLARTQNDITLKNCYFANFWAFAIGCQDGNPHRLTLDGLTAYSRAGTNVTGGFFLNGRVGRHFTMKNCHLPYLGIYETGSDINIIDNVVGGYSHNFAVYTDEAGVRSVGDGGVIRNMRIEQYYGATTVLQCSSPNVHVENVSVRFAPEPHSFFSGQPDIPGYVPSPFYLSAPEVLAGAAVAPSAARQVSHAMLDPGEYAKRFPSTWKGVIGGNLHFPGGLDMLSEPLTSVRGISGTTTRSNNLSGTVAVTAGAVSALVAFPTRAQENVTTLSLAANNAGASGSLAAGTYFYRAAARSVDGGPVVAVSQVSVVVGAPNNAVKLSVGGMIGATTYIDAVTIFRGPTGAPTTRYDVVPIYSVHGWSTLSGVKRFIDYGTTVVPSDDASSGYGTTAVTSTTPFVGSPAWDGAKWISVDETGWELDLAYRLQVTPSWSTTVWVGQKRVNGFPVSFGTPAPVGASFDWVLTRG